MTIYKNITLMVFFLCNDIVIVIFKLSLRRYTFDLTYFYLSKLMS